jgi:hypothetical protein
MAKPVKGKQQKPRARNALATKKGPDPIRRRQFDQAQKAYISDHTTRHAMQRAAVTVSTGGSQTMTGMTIFFLTQLVDVAATGLKNRKTLQGQDLKEAFTAMTGVVPVKISAAAKPAKPVKPATDDNPEADAAVEAQDA